MNMKLSVLSFLFILINHVCAAEIPQTETLYAPKPKDIAQAQLSAYKEVDYMVENYSLPELARVAIRINKVAIAQAHQNGTIPPTKLTREIIQDREKLADYIRSQYKFTY